MYKKNLINLKFQASEYVHWANNIWNKGALKFIQKYCIKKKKLAKIFEIRKRAANIP